MTKQGLFVIWFSLLVWPGQAQVPKPEQCLISRIYSLIQLPETKDYMSCWNKCMAEPNCHMAVVTKPLSASSQCLLVNCLNQGNHSIPRDPSTEINVYSKSSMDNEQREFLRERAYQPANERLRCFDSINDSSCRSGVPRFFYNSTSYRCEQFFSGCGSNKNSFETGEGCEALCNEKFRCYRPKKYGGCSARFSKFFYNVTSRRCERFNFSGCGSNGNIFSTAEECEQLCGDGEGDTSLQKRFTEQYIKKMVCLRFQTLTLNGNSLLQQRAPALLFPNLPAADHVDQVCSANQPLPLPNQKLEETNSHGLPHSILIRHSRSSVTENT